MVFVEPRWLILAITLEIKMTGSSRGSETTLCLVPSGTDIVCLIGSHILVLWLLRSQLDEQLDV
jgi:hypothetical protein